jgi:oligopeptide/dipeptide ABC transporter ATP-binding protein
VKESIVSTKNLVKHFPVKQTLLGNPGQFIYAVNGVDLELRKGKTTGLVGESGCGKTTIGHLITGLEKPDSGEVLFKGKPIWEKIIKDRKVFSREIQIVFQNPFGALNPRKKIYHVFKEVLKVHGIVPKEKVEDKIVELLKTVAVPVDSINHYPFEFSGGQRQRLCIARSLTLEPEILICDEPVSALDVSVQSQILKLLKELQIKFQLTYLFISHDLSVIYHMCDYIYVMYLGKIMEEGAVDDIFNNPQHPYTEALLSAIPLPDPTSKQNRIILRGEIPNPTQLPSGCFFYSRCFKRMDICHKNHPPLFKFSHSHFSRCWLSESKTGSYRNHP